MSVDHVAVPRGARLHSESVLLERVHGRWNGTRRFAPMLPSEAKSDGPEESNFENNVLRSNAS